MSQMQMPQLAQLGEKESDAVAAKRQNDALIAERMAAQGNNETGIQGQTTQSG